MSNSSLVTYYKKSPNYNIRNDKIRKITIHHMAGNTTVKVIGDIFANRERQGSSNYAIDNNLDVGMYVEENKRSWCSNSRSNDHQAITIELANDGGAPDWHVSDKVINKCIELCVDICKRNGIEKLVYTGDVDGNLTRHDMFADTTCPGPYLASKLPYIADEVNKRLITQPQKRDGINMRQICYGSKNSAVRVWQAILNIAVDGNFGPNTRNATIDFQTKHGLKADGIVGPLTWAEGFNVVR